MNRCLCTLALTLLSIAPAPAQEPKVYNRVEAARLEKILADLKIDAKKSPGKKEGIFEYEYGADAERTKLINYEGFDLWLEHVVPEGLPLEAVNRWNARARYSRAVLVKQEDKASLSFESQLDCIGGVTDAVVRQFVQRFDTERREFAEFLKQEKK